MGLFSRKGSHLVGIDVSTISVKLVDIRRKHGGFYLKSYAIDTLPAGAVVDKIIVDPEQVGAVIAKLAERCDVAGQDAATAIPPSAVITKIIDMSASLNDAERESQIRLDANQYIPYPLDEVNLDFDVIGPSLVNDNRVQVLLAASRSENVEQRMDALVFGGMKTKVIDIESHAIERAFLLMLNSLPHQSSLVALVDIGYSQTTLYVAKEGQFVYSREQLFGEAQLIESIQSRYGLSFEDALINKYEKTLPEDYRQALLLPFVDHLVQQIIRSLQFYFSSSQYNSVDHIVLSGCATCLPELTAMMQQKLNTSASTANPFITMSVNQKIDHEQLIIDAPELMVASGLALRSIK